MKIKTIFYIVLLICLLIFPQITVYASNYNVYGTDLTVEMDDSEWYIFTRDNIKNNDELSLIGATYEYMYDILYNNDAYLDAILFYEDDSFIEFLIRKMSFKDVEVVADYSFSSYDDAAAFAEKIAETVGTENYDVYKSKQYYAKVDFFDSKTNTYNRTYATVINGEFYTFTFQSLEELTGSKYFEIKEVIDGVNFKTVEVTTNTASIVTNDSVPSIFDGVLEKAISGVVTAFIFIATPFLYRLGKKKKMETIKKGKVYYGLFCCRILGFFVLSVMISEMVLLLILGDSIDGTPALILTILVASLFTGLFAFLYKNIFEKYLNKNKTIYVSDADFNKKESDTVKTKAFSQKEKVTIEDMSKKAMVISIDFIGNLKNFYDIDDTRAIAVNLGYFYGFLKIQLNSITSSDVADKIIERAINHTENALEGTVGFEDFALIIKEFSSKSIDNMHYAMKEFKDKPFTILALCYLADLSNDKTVSVNEERMEIAEANVHKLYGITSSITQNIKIVK